MVIVLNCITDVYSVPDNKTGKQKIIKKNVKFKKSFETNNIQIQSYIDLRGNLSTKYTMINEGEQSYKALHKFEDVERLILPVKIKGFR